MCQCVYKEKKVWLIHVSFFFAERNHNSDTSNINLFRGRNTEGLYKLLSYGITCHAISSFTVLLYFLIVMDCNIYDPTIHFNYFNIPRLHVFFSSSVFLILSDGLSWFPDYSGMGDGIQVAAELTALHDRNPFNYLLFDAPLTCVCVCVCLCVWPCVCACGRLPVWNGC